MKIILMLKHGMFRDVSGRIHNSLLQHISVTSMLLNRRFLHTLKFSVAAELSTEMR